MPRRTVDEEKPEMPPLPETDWERAEQEKLPPRGSGSQDNQGPEKDVPRPEDVPEDDKELVR